MASARPGGEGAASDGIVQNDDDDEEGEARGWHVT